MRVLADARMEMRLSALDKKVLTQAATLLDTNASAFILNAALAEARRVLDSARTVRLAPRDFRIFAAALLHPTPATPALVRARERLALARAAGGFPVAPLEAGQPWHDTLDTGLPSVDAFLRRRAAPFARHDLARTYVVADTAGGTHARLLASYTLAKAEVWASPRRRRDAGAAHAGAESLPVLRLGCLAVSARVREQGLGEMLVADAIERAHADLAPAATAALVADAPDAEALGWYARFGFAALASTPATAYLVLGARTGPD